MPHREPEFRFFEEHKRAAIGTVCLLPFDLIVIVSFWPSLRVIGTPDHKYISPLSNLECGPAPS